MTHATVEHFKRAMEFSGLAPCPQDGHWQIPTDSDICTEVETLQLLFGLVRTLRPLVVVETGCNVGCASAVIAHALEANQYGHLYTCDVDASFVGRTQERTGVVWATAHVMSGMEIVKHYDQADVYWIDSSEASRSLELEWLRIHGKHGAVVLVHDTSLMGELAMAVKSFPNHVLLPGPRGLGVITL